MSSQYITEPPPTARVLLNTTAGPLTISIFAQQTPLTARNFLQHCLDGYYDGNIFHRVAPGFVIQTGDPTGTGEGGQTIYEDREFERYDKDWATLMKRDVEGDEIQFGDEVHTRLKFNRRGLVGLAKGTGQGGGYGSQFFITLGDCRAELDGKCTMFGRVEGDGIYNVVKVAEAELIEGTERPMYPEKILNVEILEMPKGAAWEKLSRRVRVAARIMEEDKPKKKSATKKKGAKALLSFGGEEGEESETVVVRPKKAKFNTSLINGHNEDDATPKPNRNGPLSGNKAESPSRRSPSPQNHLKRKADPEPSRHEPHAKRHSHSPTPKRRKPSFHDSTTQLPLRNPESPFQSQTSDDTSPPPSHHRRTSSTKKSTSALEAEIAALKQSMRRPDINTGNDSKSKPKSALEALIPATSTRGRKRPRPGESNDKEQNSTLKLLNAFKARLEKADTTTPNTATSSHPLPTPESNLASASVSTTIPPPLDEEDPPLCDLHFIANCQSCTSASLAEAQTTSDLTEDIHDRTSFLGHALTFEKDRLGKDLTWKRKNEEELLVIDPREKEKELHAGGKKGKGKGGKEWDMDRDRTVGGRGIGGVNGGKDRDRDRDRERGKARDRDRRK